MKFKPLRRIHLTINRKWWYLAGIAFFLLFFVFGDTGFYNYARLHYRRHQTKNEIEQAKKQNAFLEQKVDALTNDSSFIEKVAREEYDMAAEDEVIIKIRESQNE
jgi:cell division protein FtsB